MGFVVQYFVEKNKKKMVLHVWNMFCFESMIPEETDGY